MKHLTSGIGDFTTLTVNKIIENVKEHGTVSSGTEIFDLNDGAYHTITVGGDFTLAFDNWPVSGTLSSVTTKLINAGAHTVTWPGEVDWPYGFEPSWTAAGIDFSVFFSDDGGTTVYGALSMQDLK